MLYADTTDENNTDQNDQKTVHPPAYHKERLTKNETRANMGKMQREIQHEEMMEQKQEVCAVHCSI